MDAGNLSSHVLQILQDKGFAWIGLRECNQNNFSLFSKSLSYAVDHNPHGPYVDKQSPEDLKKNGARVFLSGDGKAGVAVWPDGNIGALFKDIRSKNRKAVGELILTALSVGGNKLDCYGRFPHDTFLLNTYAAFGFIPVARVGFNREFAPDNWMDKFGEPDVIFWRHCGDPVEVVAKKIYDYHFCFQADIEALPVFPSYEEAYQFRDDQQARNF